MKSKAEVFFEAITLLGEDLVEEAQDYRFRKKPAVWKKLGGLAACLALIVALSLLALPGGGSDSAPPSAGENSSGAPSGDSCAPSDAPADGAVSGAPVPEEPSGGPEAGRRQLDAVVLEIREDSLLVESGGTRIAVSTTGLALPELAEGDAVRIAYDGPVPAAPDAVIDGTRSVEKIEDRG